MELYLKFPFYSGFGLDRFHCIMQTWVLIPPLHRRGWGGGGILFYPCPSVQDIFRLIFLSNYWWQKSDIWSQASYRFLDPSDSYFLFADLVGFYTHWTYMRGYNKWASAHSSSCYRKYISILLSSSHFPKVSFF